MLVGILLIGAFLIGGAALAVGQARDHAIEQAYLRTGGLAQAVDHHASLAFRSIGLTLAVSVDRLEADAELLQSRTAHLFLQDRAADVAHIDRIFATGPDGEILYDSRDFPTVPLNVADRPYFRAHRDGGTSGLFISDPFRSKRTGNWIIIVSQRLNGPGRSFAGVAAAVIDLARLQQFYETVRPGAHGAAALITSSGKLVARSPLAEIGKDLSDTPLFRRHLPQADHGAYEAASSVDGVMRLHTYRKLTGLPFVVLVSTAKDEALARWREEAMHAAIGAFALLGVLTLAGIIVAREARRRQRAEKITQSTLLDLTHKNEILAAHETALREANQRLQSRSEQLELRNLSIDLLSRMAHRLQSCTDEDEFAETVRRFVPQILPGVAGALYLLTNSRTLLRPVAIWNEPQNDMTEFPLADCWAVRRGQMHSAEPALPEIPCKHRGDLTGEYACIPIAAQGEVLGTLYLEIGSGAVLANVASTDILVENIGLALGNHRLREALRAQSIRDPLTGLFNRRYLDETLEIEIARAEREQRSVAVIMLDVDHFKRFNDTFGHDAGDAVLKAVGGSLARSVRKGDLACRYGGEEFTLVLPGAAIDDAFKRAEFVRESIRKLAPTPFGTPLGAISASLGVATYPQDGLTPAQLINAADQALYRAKQGGRDRTEVGRADAQAEIRKAG